jgi:hypothetical protein
MQVPQEEREDFRAVVDELGYANSDETDNPAFALFLGR